MTKSDSFFLETALPWRKLPARLHIKAVSSRRNVDYEFSCFCKFSNSREKEDVVLDGDSVTGYWTGEDHNSLVVFGSRGVLSFESWASVCKLVLWGSWPKGVWQAKICQEGITRPYLMVLRALFWCRKRIFIGRCKSFLKKSKKIKKSFDSEWDVLYILQNVKCFWLMSSNGCYRRSSLRAGFELCGCPNEGREEQLSVYRC